MMKPHELLGVTPGPWTSYKLIKEHDHLTLYTGSPNPYNNLGTINPVARGDMKQNAKLIEAAPDLFDALVHLLRAADPNAPNFNNFDLIMASRMGRHIINKLNPTIL